MLDLDEHVMKRQTEISKDVFKVRLCHPPILVMVDELECLLELLHLLGLEEREHARDLSSRIAMPGTARREVVRVFGHKDLAGDLSAAVPSAKPRQARPQDWCHVMPSAKR